jgi:hypothetical protein
MRTFKDLRVGDFAHALSANGHTYATSVLGLEEAQNLIRTDAGDFEIDPNASAAFRPWSITGYAPDQRQVDLRTLERIPPIALFADMAAFEAYHGTKERTPLGRVSPGTCVWLLLTGTNTLSLIYAPLDYPKAGVGRLHNFDGGADQEFPFGASQDDPRRVLPFVDSGDGKTLKVLAKRAEAMHDPGVHHPTIFLMKDLSRLWVILADAVRTEGQRIANKMEGLPPEYQLTLAFDALHCEHVGQLRRYETIRQRREKTKRDERNLERRPGFSNLTSQRGIVSAVENIAACSEKMRESTEDLLSEHNTAFCGMTAEDIAAMKAENARLGVQGNFGDEPERMTIKRLINKARAGALLSKCQTGRTYVDSGETRRFCGMTAEDIAAMKAENARLGGKLTSVVQGDYAKHESEHLKQFNTETK